MKQTLLKAVVAVVAATLLLGLAYPLAVMAIAQVAFTGRRPPLAHAVSSPRYFHPRPSTTGYATEPTAFANRGPNQRSAKAFYEQQLAAYLKREGPFNPGLKASGVPIDAVTDSASGVDPDISEANARIQAHRIAAVRQEPVGRVLALIHGSSVDVDALNRELDR